MLAANLTISQSPIIISFQVTPRALATFQNTDRSSSNCNRRPSIQGFLDRSQRHVSTSCEERGLANMSASWCSILTLSLAMPAASAHGAATSSLRQQLVGTTVKVSLLHCSGFIIERRHQYSPATSCEHVNDLLCVPSPGNGGGNSRARDGQNTVIDQCNRSCSPWGRKYTQTKGPVVDCRLRMYPTMLVRPYL
jgi:hypothetical protein